MSKPGGGGFFGAVQQALLRTFVGREGPLKVLEGLLDEARREPRVVHCLGAGGMGKTALLAVFGERTRKRGHRVSSVAMGERNTAQLLEGLEPGLLGRGAEADVVILDGVERDKERVGSFLDAVLREAGAKVLVVMAGREPPALSSSAQAALEAVSREIRLKPLSEAETIEALARRGVPEKQRAELAVLAAGLPRAIVELAERARVDRPTPYAERPAGELGLAIAQGIVRDAPSPLHRRAIEALSVVAALDQPLLGAMLAGGTGSPSEAEIRELYDWLGGLSIVARSTRGLIAHARVREALHHELGARDPVARRELGKRAAQELILRVDDAGLATRHQHVLEALFAQRDIVSLGTEGGGSSFFEGATERLRRTTEAEAELAARWLVGRARPPRSVFDAVRARHPQRLLSLSIGRGEPTMFALLVGLEELDPSLRAAHPILAELAGTPRAERSVVLWSWSSEPREAPSSEHLTLEVAIAMLVVDEMPNVRFLFAPLPQSFETVAEDVGAKPLGSKATDPGERLFVTDLFAMTDGMGGAAGLERLVRAIAMAGASAKAAPPDLWADASSSHVAPTEPGREAAPPAVVSIEEAVLNGWVRSALASRHRPHDLATSPLLELRVVQARIASGLAAPEALGSLLDDACRSLSHAPGYSPAARLLEVTYLDPRTVKQEAAATDLGLPFGTYRYQLRRALELVTKEIAKREADGATRSARD